MSIHARRARVFIASFGALMCASASAADMPLAACDSASFQTVLHASGERLEARAGERSARDQRRADRIASTAGCLILRSLEMA